MSQAVAEQVRPPPRGHVLTAPRAGSNRPIILGCATPHPIYFQFIHGAHGDAGVRLDLSINLLPMQDGDPIPKRSLKTRKQFNLGRRASPEGPGLQSELLNGTVRWEGGWKMRRQLPGEMSHFCNLAKKGGRWERRTFFLQSWSPCFQYVCTVKVRTNATCHRARVFRRSVLGTERCHTSFPWPSPGSEALAGPKVRSFGRLPHGRGSAKSRNLHVGTRSVPLELWAQGPRFSCPDLSQPPRVLLGQNHGCEAQHLHTSNGDAPSSSLEPARPAHAIPNRGSKRAPERTRTPADWRVCPRSS